MVPLGDRSRAYLASAGVSAAELAFRHLFDAVIRGDLPAGAIETEERLATRCGVSRTPLRDAIRRLEQLRLLLREPGRGLRVAPLSVDEMHALSATREVIEGLLACSAADRVERGVAGVERLHDLHARHARVLTLDDPDLALAVGLDFHEELRRLSGNESAIACHEHVLLGFERYRRLARDVPERRRRVAEEHAEILSAVARGRSKAAETAMRRHIRAGRDVYADILSSTLEPA